MTACSTNTCGVGGWGGPLPGDPDNNSVLTATPAFGGIDVSWSYPAVNPQAVAHTLLYRGLTNDFNSALQIAVVSGSFYYDKTDTTELVQYFYWIKIVSVNGTVGELIGPASATAKPTIDQMIELLSGRIDSGVLAQALRTDIARIELVSAELQAEINNRNAANAATSLLLSELQAEINASLGIITDEITGRQEGESALLAEVNAAAAAIALESTTRAAEIQNEAGARATGLLNEASARASGLSALQSQIGTLQAASSGDFSELLSVLQTEQTARIAGDTAEAASRETLAVQMRGNYLGSNPAELSTGLLFAERQARITADEAVVSSLNALTATVGANSASLTAESTARANADTALSNQFTTLSAQVNNATTGLPATRATLLNNYYTKTATDSAISAATLNLVSTTGLSTALASYPTTASLTQNYYTKSATDAAISSATTTLTSNFNTTLGTYVPTATLTNNYYTKTATDQAISTASTTLSSAFDVKLGLYTPTATLTNLYYTKTQADSAITAATQNLVSTTALNTALSGYSTTAVLNTNYYTKTATDSAISAATQNLISTTALNTALSSYPTTATLTTNYYTKTQTDSAISSATSTLVSNAGLNTALGAYTTTSALQTNYYTKAQSDSAISSAITTSQTTLNGNIASAQSTLQTNINTVDGKVTAIGARYTAVVSANGLVGGFGVYNNGTVIQAGFDVNEFWVGSTQANKRKPFIISGGVTYIDDAAINKLTFTKLRDEAGAVMIENGKIKANYLQVTSISGGSYSGYNWPASGTGFHLGPSGLLLGRYDSNDPTSGYFQFDTATKAIYMNGMSIVNGQIAFSGTVINTNNINNESVNIFKLARGAALPDYVRTYKGATTPQVFVNSWMPLQLDTSALNNKLGAVDTDAYRILLPAGTYFYELSVPVKCQGSDTNDAAYTAIIVNPPGTAASTTTQVCENVYDEKSGWTYVCRNVTVYTNFQELSTSGVNVVGDWQTATIFGVGRFTVNGTTHISAAVKTTDGFPALNVVARNGYSTTILRIWRDAT